LKLASSIKYLHCSHNMEEHSDALFEEVHRRGKAISDKKNKSWSTMSVIVDAVTEVLQQQNQQTTPIAYFGAFLSALEREKNTSHIAALLHLIFLTAQRYFGCTHAYISIRIPISVFRSKFEYLAVLFNNLLEKFDKHEFIIANVTNFFDNF
jgi:hypothetical protein